MNVTALIGNIAMWVELAGVTVIVVGIVNSTVHFFRDLRPQMPASDAYKVYRAGIGKAILLGLEMLVAADIVRTVAVSPSFGTVGLLAAIVLIRTFLSMTLELEITGRWPWQRPAPPNEPTDNL
jgi:uncharacterized membrane protein